MMSHFMVFPGIKRPRAEIREQAWLRVPRSTIKQRPEISDFIDTHPMHFDVIVIGAGAAGMMCAAQAGGRGRRVLLIDHVEKVGERIRISGGGRWSLLRNSSGW